MKKLMHMNMKEGNSVRSHLNEFNNVFLQLTSKGLNFDDEMKAIFLLCSLPSSWDTFNTAISNSSPGGTLVFSDVTSALLTEEIQHQSLDASGHGDAYMASDSRANDWGVRLLNVIGKPAKIKFFGVVKSLEVEAYDAKAVVNFHVMPAGLGAYPIILGRPWLHAMGAVQDWRYGTISLYGKTGAKKLYNINTRKVLEEPCEDEDESSDEDYSTVSDEDSDSTSSDEDVHVAFLLMDKEIHDSGLVAFANEIEDECEGPYEVIEGLVQTKVKSEEEERSKSLPNDKGKAKVDDVDAMPIKRARQEEAIMSETRERRKSKEIGESSSKKKSKPRQKITVKDFALEMFVDEFSSSDYSTSEEELTATDESDSSQAKIMGVVLTDPDMESKITNKADFKEDLESLKGDIASKEAIIRVEFLYDKLMKKVSRVKEDDLQDLNLGCKGSPKVVKNSVHLDDAFKEGLKQLLQEFIDVFVWDYFDLKGIIRKMVQSKPKLWDALIDGALWAYRTTYRCNAIYSISFGVWTRGFATNRASNSHHQTSMQRRTMR
ncbi:hypothetical protein L7F22_041580 [Adiantum nelumboides]|nr:hypothetical protein [Adiantum nelumboides]